MCGFCGSPSHRAEVCVAVTPEQKAATKRRLLEESRRALADLRERFKTYKRSLEALDAAGIARSEVEGHQK